jgi:hypothetical protein
LVYECEGGGLFVPWIFTFDDILFFFDEDSVVVAELHSMFGQPWKMQILERLEELGGRLFVNLNFHVAIDEMLLVDEG